MFAFRSFVCPCRTETRSIGVMKAFCYVSDKRQKQEEAQYKMIKVEIGIFIQILLRHADAYQCAMISLYPT